MVEALEKALIICRERIKEFKDPIARERWEKIIAKYQAWVDASK